MGGEKVVLHGDEAYKVLQLLQRIESGYQPTTQEQNRLWEISSLDLSVCNIDELPESIELLTKLEELDVSGNQLEFLPYGIGRLPNLRRLDARGNRLESLPENIGELSRLESLDVSRNALVSLPESIGSLASLRRLDIYSNELAILPDSMGGLWELTYLDADNNELTSLPESIYHLPGLKKLSLSINRLTVLPESIGYLNGLVELSLFINRLTSLPESIGQLTQLSSLDCDGNGLSSMPDAIGQLKNLVRLDLARNRLTDLPENLANLSSLKILNLRANRLERLPECIRAMESLSDLYLDGNPIPELPNWLGDMPRLTALNLNGMGLREVPAWVRRLMGLEELILDKNPLSVLPDWLGDMPQLHTLSLRNLRLMAFPESLLKLNATFLSDSSQRIFSDGLYIRIDDTELSIQPVALFDQSRDASPNRQVSRRLIENYFAEPKVPIREAKVIFLGDGKVGKTYTIQRLLHDCRRGEYPTQETHGILIEELKAVRNGQTYRVRVWDFGGQDIMHEMHRCFLTDRTCYVVMVDTRSDHQTGRARYWLRTVQSVAPNAPALLLVNEISGSTNRDLDYSALRREFPNLVGVQYCSSLSASDEEFREKVEKAIFDQSLLLDSCKMELPESWEQVRQHLLRQKSEKMYYIDRGDFHALCDRYGVPKDDDLRAWLLTWFNDMGVCFSYHMGEDGQEQQRDYKILDPMWLTSAVYKVIWEKERTDDGLIARSEIDRILSQPGSDALKKDGIPCLEGVAYNPAECGYVLEIMRKFRISYAADERTEFMPTLCKADSKLDPTPCRWRQHAAYQFRYTFLPESVLHRLMIYCYANLRPGKRWRKGFWLESEAYGLSAVIRTTGRYSEENTLQIDVYAQKEPFEAWMWLQPLCREIMTINERLSLKAESYVLAENDQESRWFSLDRVWHWRMQRASSLQGDRSLFEIKPLLELIYGNYYAEAERGLMNAEEQGTSVSKTTQISQSLTQEIAERTQIDLSKPLDGQLLAPLERMAIAMERQAVAAEREAAALEQSTLTMEQVAVCLTAIRDGEITLPQEIDDALVQLLTLSEERQQEGVSKRHRVLSGLRDRLGDAANLAAVAAVVYPWFAAHQAELPIMIRQLLGL